MPRISSEHEILLGYLDNIFVFAYLYESERQCNPDLETLRGFAREIKAKAGSSINASSLQKEASLSRTICHVLNVLQRACKRNDPEPDVAIDAAWDGLPDRFASEDLWRMHDERREDLARAFVTLLTQLANTFSDELRPYVTRELVAAAFRELRRSAKLDFIGPVQVEILSAIVHQTFLVAASSGDAPTVSPAQLQAMVDSYVHQANQNFQHLITSAFVQETVEELFPRARRLKISLDRIYPWGGLWEAPYYGDQLLQVYADLIRSAAIQDKKYKGPAKPLAEVPSDVFGAFVSWAVNEVPEPRIPSEDPVPQTCYNTDDTDVVVGGKFLQKYAVLTVPYDKPLPDVERTVRRFRNFLLAQRKKYCENSRESLSAAEVTMEHRLRQELQPQARTHRTLVHDVSTVIWHMCAMLHIEKMHDPRIVPTLNKAYADLLNYQQHDVIAGIANNAYFRFSAESVRKMCVSIPAQCKALREGFLGPQVPA